VQGTVIPALADEGIEAGSLPVFLSYEAAWPVGDVTNLGNCCAIGYHNATGTPIVTQTYSVADFDRTQFFSGPARYFRMRYAMVASDVVTGAGAKWPARLES
jgi:hypothetical protein